QAEDGIRDFHVTGVQTCALPILRGFRVGVRLDVEWLLAWRGGVHALHGDLAGVWWRAAPALAGRGGGVGRAYPHELGEEGENGRSEERRGRERVEVWVGAVAVAE